MKAYFIDYDREPFESEHGDWVEADDVEKLLDLLKATAEALKDVLRGDDGEADIQAELILQRVEGFLRGECCGKLYKGKDNTET